MTHRLALRPRTEPTLEQYHAFATIQLCYPSGFYGNSLKALRLSPSCQPSTTVLRGTKKGNTTKSLPSASADTASAKSETSGQPNASIRRRKSGVLQTEAREESDQNTNPGGRRAYGVSQHSESPLRRRRGPRLEVTARAPRLQPLPSTARGQSCSAVCGDGNRDSRRGSGEVFNPKPNSARQSSSKAGCLPEVGNGDGYWSVMGRKGGGDVHHNCEVRSRIEQSESAVASVVLLRWAMECFSGNEDCGIVDGVSDRGCKAGVSASTGQAREDSARGTSKLQGQAMNATVSGPVHLMHAERKPRDTDLFLFSDPFESGGKRSADASYSPRMATSTSFAATSPTPLAFSQSRNPEIPKGLGQTRPREVRVSAGDGRESRSPPESNHRDSSDISVASSPPRQETKDGASGKEGPSGRNSWIAGRTTVSRGEWTEDVRSTKRYVCPKMRDAFTVCSFHYNKLLPSPRDLFEYR